MDTDRQADEAWILSVQRKLYQWSKANPDDAWRDMWGWLTDPRMLRHAWRRVASNQRRRSAGVDGMTVGRIRARIGEQRFLEELQAELRSGAYRPSPSRRKLIPKAGKPGQFRPLGIPTVKDRVVQGAVKALIGAYLRSAILACLLRVSARTEHPWRFGVYPPMPSCRRNATRTVGGAGCRIHGLSKATSRAVSTTSQHHHLMNRLRARVGDRRVTRLVGQFLKAGVLAEDQFLRTDDGTPQGGIISPLLSNIVLSAIEERYERWAYHRTKLYPVAKAMGLRRQEARGTGSESRSLCVSTRALRRRLYPAGVRHKGGRPGGEIRSGRLPARDHRPGVVAGKDEGHGLDGRIRVPRIPLRCDWNKCYGFGTRVEVPKAKAADLRHRVKQLTGRNTTLVSLGRKLPFSVSKPWV